MSYTHLAEHDRFRIFHHKQAELSNAEATRHSGRHRATVGRELRRFTKHPSWPHDKLYVPDYYLEGDEFDDRVERYAHGVRLGSNYLFLDIHVSNDPPRMREGLVDPWDVPLPELEASTTAR